MAMPPRLLLVALLACWGADVVAPESEAVTWLNNVTAEATVLTQDLRRLQWDFYRNASGGVQERLNSTVWSLSTLLTNSTQHLQPSTNDTTLNRELQLLEVISKQNVPQRLLLELQMLGEVTAATRHIPGITDADVRSSQKLLASWQAVREAVSTSHVSQTYQEYVKASDFSSDDLKQPSRLNVTSEASALYRRLHAYVRRELKRIYGPHRLPVTGHLPAHFVDGADGVTWERYYHLLRPFKDEDENLMLDKISTVEDLFRSEDFYTSLGFPRLPDSFWKSSILSKASDNTSLIVCHPPSAWDLYNNDFRVIACLEENNPDMRTAVEVMGEVYMLQIKNGLPYTQRTSPLDSVTDAIKGALSLAFLTPAHLASLSKTASTLSQTEVELNFLLHTALSRLPSATWQYVVNQWRTAVFSEQLPPVHWEEYWWKLRCEHEGVSPPVTLQDKDSSAFTSPSLLLNAPWIRDEELVLTQFQVLRALCRAANHTGPLASCNIQGSREVGELIRKAFREDSTLTASDRLRNLTGSSTGDVSALMDFFRPLNEWLSITVDPEDTKWLAVCPDPTSGKVQSEDAMRDFLRRHEDEVRPLITHQMELEWIYSTNITDYNQEMQVNGSLVLSHYAKRYGREAAMFDIKNIKNATLYRLMSPIADIGTYALKDEAKLKRLSEVMATMLEIYSKAKVCLTPDTCLPLDPDVSDIMAKNRSYDGLAHVWTSWRDATGRKMKDLYAEFVRLGNEGVRTLGHTDMGEYWRSLYADDNFQSELETLLHQLQPLYQQLHAYVRNRLLKFYGDKYFPATGHIPAHLLGDMWAQQWHNILDLLVPFPEKESVDVTREMVRQNYTALLMFKTAEEFYTSIGLPALPQEFWNNSMFVRPHDGREVVCHASAWDFVNGKDFRIKMCTDVTMEDLITIHHEMGHIQYYLLYKDQPFGFQEGANPGFHEAIGDVIALSVATPSHLHKIRLLSSPETDNETDINFLFKTALEKVAFLPFGYLIDQWRWSVFSGETSPDSYNSKWWELRCQFQGISPPVNRSADDFDPGAKFHVPNNMPYIRYFVSFVLQFMFHKRLCEEAGHKGPLHRCDIYQSAAAGNLFKNMLQKGSSQPWQDILRDFNDQTKMSATALLEYFQPLTEWLAIQNKGLPVGWTPQCPPGTTDKIRDIGLARGWIHHYNTEAKVKVRELNELAWNYDTNITDDNQKKQDEGQFLFANWQQAMAADAESFDWQNFGDDSLVRQFRFASDIGTSAMKNATKLKRLNELQSSLEGIYGKAKVCDDNSNCLDLEPGLTRLLRESRDYDKLLWAWQGWRNATGPKMKDGFVELVELMNEAVKPLGYADSGAYWRSSYESETLENDVEQLLTQLAPLYKQLHAYVRRKLMEIYGEDRFPYSGHIPAHLLGDMWAQEWGSLNELFRPFKDKGRTDITPELLRQGFTVERMFTLAEEFFVSLGLEPMPQSFWRDSMMEKPDDGRDVVCHASAWDFGDGKDFRIKMCTDITMEDLITIHHEMGHIQYYLQYKDQPYLFQSGANSGFHEAIGDTLAMSVATPRHLHKLQLLPSADEDEETTINYLMSIALDKIAFLPFGYLVDQWRWRVFSGETTPSEYNDKWWQLRCKYQGVSPPVARSSEDFDPGAKYHVAASVPYLRYFVSGVLQFQFYKALCQAAGHTGPLHTCDFYGSQEAGQALSKMLQLGSSRPWPEALEMLTGTRRMDSGPLIEYFQPLVDWLSKENAGYEEGWREECPQTEQEDAGRWLKEYDRKLQQYRVAEVTSDWNYETNITEETSERSVNASTQLAIFQREQAAEVQRRNWTNIPDASMRRQFQMLTNIGPSALKDQAKVEEMETLQSKMEGIYGAGKVCLDSPDHCLSLEPDLEDILANNRSYDRLLAVWKGWRDATGPAIKPLYQQFVALSNEGVRELGYADTGEYWRSFYESETLQSDLEGLLEQLSPLYTQLQAYVRSKLMHVYGPERFPASGHIPAHLLGNMWSQEWGNIYDLVQPYPNRTAISVTKAMTDQGYTVERMFRTAEQFFVSLGLESMPETFWAGSMLQKPADRDVVCHASAWDFYDGRDFRIKMCTYITMEDLLTIHHEMGHIEYFLQYRHQPQMFRDGANPGFHEAIGDTISLSAASAGHLRKIGLLAEGTDNYMDEVNFLMKMALDKVAFLPFGYLIDQWRWRVFSGEITPESYNSKWWQYRCQYQGVSPPVSRSEADFDPGAKFHVPANSPYISYFVAHVLQFQFHQALCQAAGHTGPLHQCDIYNSSAAGQKLMEMLRQGASVPWPDLLEKMTGTRRMDASALLNYFRPLYDWLREANSGERLGWTRHCPENEAVNQKTPTPTPNTTCKNSGVAMRHDLKTVFVTVVVSLIVVLLMQRHAC
ncbi:angiotensin-converting enzyme-like isoform X2 [Pomacea canaliculata]|uniref:angiotensin-converting enzyme-like isoform X2 n=1 Tax=Pomacea canaliculata TaxID=400727 RepID=UPI000D727FF4|nr:angiotensin-converting enzyme-like isoform X2 [Pomacea canaliculata]